MSLHPTSWIGELLSGVYDVCPDCGGNWDEIPLLHEKSCHDCGRNFHASSGGGGGKPSKTTAGGKMIGRTVPRSLSKDEVHKLDELSRTNPKEYEKQLSKYARETGMDKKRVHAEVASFQLDETIAKRRASPSSSPKG